MNDFRNDVLFFYSIWGYIDVSDFLYGNNERTVFAFDILRTMSPSVLISTMLFLQRLNSRSEKRTTQRKHNLANKTAAMVLAFLLSNSKVIPISIGITHFQLMQSSLNSHYFEKTTTFSKILETYVTKNCNVKIT